jgi:hypothetical protein
LRAGNGYRGVDNDAARAIENCARNGATVRLSSSRYSEECKEKTKGKKPQQGQIESHFSPRPKRHRSPNKPSTSPPPNLNRDASPSLRTIEIPTIRHITGKNTCKPVCAIGFRNRLLATLYQCWLTLVKFFFPLLSCFLMVVVCASQFMIGWARERPSLGKSSFQGCLSL